MAWLLSGDPTGEVETSSRRRENRAGRGGTLKNGSEDGGGNAAFLLTEPIAVAVSNNLVRPEPTIGVKSGSIMLLCEGLRVAYREGVANRIETSGVGGAPSPAL